MDRTGDLTSTTAHAQYDKKPRINPIADMNEPIQSDTILTMQETMRENKAGQPDSRCEDHFIKNALVQNEPFSTNNGRKSPGQIAVEIMSRLSPDEQEHEKQLSSISFDKILGHYYKKRSARFRVSCDSHPITMIVPIDEVIEKRELMISYLKGLGTKAITTIIRRHPEVLTLLRKESRRHR